MSTAKRALELAKIGLGVRKVAKSQTEDDKRRARKALAALFADARGVTMKFGQLLAEHSGEDPFADLVTSIDPLPRAKMLPVIEDGLGRPWTEVFRTIDESEAAASLGQVHHGELLDGTPVAIKVRYPGIADAVGVEMTLAGLIPGVGPMKKWGFDLGGYKRVLKNNMDRELDYRSEADRQVRFRAGVTVPGLVVPAVYRNMTSEKVLVQDWETGVRLDQVASWPEADRKAIGRILLATLFKSLFKYGEIHGDPHLGNTYYRMGADGRAEVVLMDYGCTLPVSEDARLALLKLLLALREDKPVSHLALYQAMEFDLKKLSYISDQLPALGRVLLLPLLGDGDFEVSTWRLRIRFEELLGENRWWFRSSGPASSVLLLRAFQGVVQQLDQIGVRLDWWKVFCETISAETMARARAFTPAPLPPEYAEQSEPKPAVKMARYLRVSVREGVSEKVSITMPAAAAEDLENLMPEDVITHIRETGEIDLDATMTRVRASGLCPQDILNFEKGPKTYKVWLE